MFYWPMNHKFSVLHWGCLKAFSVYYPDLSTGARIMGNFGGCPEAPGKCSSCECFDYLKLSHDSQLPHPHTYLVRQGRLKTAIRWEVMNFRSTAIVERPRKITFVFDLCLMIWNYVSVFLFVIYENTLVWKLLRGLKSHPLSIDSIKAQIWFQ